mmetsp:Transcript_17731/g.43857  ORF Transcript_17731/g.43857 Transcript_17731/m.43857 type:complete len:200 (+) Transcript_17731:2425-3024(+)
MLDEAVGTELEALLVPRDVLALPHDAGGLDGVDERGDPGEHGGVQHVAAARLLDDHLAEARVGPEVAVHVPLVRLRLGVAGHPQLVAAGLVLEPRVPDAGGQDDAQQQGQRHGGARPLAHVVPQREVRARECGVHAVGQAVHASRLVVDDRHAAFPVLPVHGDRGFSHHPALLLLGIRWASNAGARSERARGRGEGEEL